MNKVEKQHNYAANNQSNGEDVNLLAQVFAGRTLADGVISVLDGQDHGDTTFGSRGIVGGDDLAGFQTSSSEVVHVDLASVEAGWSRCCPSGNVTGIGNDRESVLSEEIHGAQPANFNGAEWVMNFDAACCVDNFGSDNKDPEQSTSCCTVEQAHETSLNQTSNEETCCSGQANDNNQRQINPVTSGAVYVEIGHVSQHIADNTEFNKDLLAKKGN